MNVCSESPTLSTFADHWKTGRFDNVIWDSEIYVDIITLDDLVNKYGIPKYCKIDVEGFELNVIQGLSHKIGTISFEFTSEFITHAMQVIERLVVLGYKEFNVSLGELPTYNFNEWIPFYELVKVLLNAAQSNPGLWGDIYAK